MSTYLFNHTKKGDGSKRVFEDADYYDEDFNDFDLFPTDLLKYMDAEYYKDLKTLNDSPFHYKNNVQKI